MDEDFDDDESGGFRCDSCGGKLDMDDEEQYHEATGWYFCPHCGHSNSGD